jgi:hypothetical protein
MNNDFRKPVKILQGLAIFLNQSEKGIHKKGGCTAMICNGDSTE